jgi:hypothetical protein
MKKLLYIQLLLLLLSAGQIHSMECDSPGEESSDEETLYRKDDASLKRSRENSDADQAYGLRDESNDFMMQFAKIFANSDKSEVEKARRIVQQLLSASHSHKRVIQVSDSESDEEESRSLVSVPSSFELESDDENSWYELSVPSLKNINRHVTSRLLEKLELTDLENTHSVACPYCDEKIKCTEKSKIRDRFAGHFSRNHVDKQMISSDLEKYVNENLKTAKNSIVIKLSCLKCNSKFEHRELFHSSTLKTHMKQKKIKGKKAHDQKDIDSLDGKDVSFFKKNFKVEAKLCLN